MDRFDRMGLVLAVAVMLFSACQPAQTAQENSSDTSQAVVAPTAASEQVAPTSVDETATPEQVATAAVDETAAPAPTRPPRVKLAAERTTFTSQALAGNLLGDPTERGVYVVLPSDYATSDKRYPVVYVLHGYTGNETSDYAEFQRVQQSALRRGTVEEMILVFPSAYNRLGGSMYLSNATIGDYETYLTQDLVNYIDTTYRTIADRNSRGITGCSMGADGALHLALKYPSVYGVAAPYSGLYDWSRDPWIELGANGYKAEPASLKDFPALPIETRGEIATAAATTPNPDKPPFFLDMPYEIIDGVAQAAPGFLAAIAAASPLQDARSYVNQPVRLNSILISHGLEDDLIPVEIVRDVSATLTELGIDHEYQEVHAWHCDMDKEPILKFMSDHLVFGEAAP
ncbi:MAG: alpha/beta hydrolase-fold protein [Caldilinea sp.]|nr:hypothetical protein [Caldilineaceae bacterium]MCO5210543.1 alpha/beta hydrolase-fold protein [Caldilinea sp.]MCW5840729.1 hypothetical protein [Caldilinea sp.]